MKMVYDNKINDYICYADEALISVVDVVVRKDYCMELSFSNGERKLYNALPLLDKPCVRQKTQEN